MSPDVPDSPDAISGDGVRGDDELAPDEATQTDEPDDDKPKPDGVNDGPDVEPEIEPNGISS